MTTRGTLQLRPATPGAHTRPGDARRKVHFALKVIAQAQATIDDFAAYLPEWTPNHVGPDQRVCTSRETYVVANDVTREDPYNVETHVAFSRDQYDDGSTQYVKCRGCEQLFALPEDLDWA